MKKSAPGIILHRLSVYVSVRRYQAYLHDEIEDWYEDVSQQGHRPASKELGKPNREQDVTNRAPRVLVSGVELIHCGSAKPGKILRMLLQQSRACFQDVQITGEGLVNLGGCKKMFDAWVA